MIKAIKAALDVAPGLSLATKKTYKKPINNTQPTTYIYFILGGKVRIKTGYRQRITFYIVSDNMDTIETLSNNLETLLVGNGNAIDPKIWKVLQLSQVDFPNEMIRTIDFTFYNTFI